ncbi:MAG: recombinase family protein [Bacilli bacterium]
MNYQKVLNSFQVAIYIRLSKEDGDKEESDSVGNQRRLLTEYISKKEDLELYDTYIDDGYTGTNFKRPSFQQMITDIESRKVNCVIVKDLSRFGRDYIETGRYLEREFPDLGVRFISINDGIDSIKQVYDMLLPIKNIFNEQYARDISKKVQSAVKSKQKAGEFIGSFTSYGYKKSPTDKNKLIIDEYASEIVRRIFALYIAGNGKQRIAMILNSEGILCPSEYKKMSGLNYGNGNKLESTTYWSHTTISSILKKEIYIGNMVQGTKFQRMRGKQKKVPKEDWIVVENTHEPIIDRDTWDKAQILLTKRTRKLDLKTDTNVFAGFLKCGDCGRAMTKMIWKLRDGTRVFDLYCGTYRRHGKHYCTPHRVPLKILENIVLDDLKKIIRSVDDIRLLVKSKNLKTKKSNEIVNTEILKIQTELERFKKLKKEIYEDYKEELITKNEYISYREDYSKKEELYLKQLEVLEKNKNENITSDIFESPWLKRLLDLKDIESLDRDIVVEMISQITIYENQKIKISYNFSDELSYLFTCVYEDGANKELI